MLLLGPSGAGKSTLLQALAGVLGGNDEGEQEGRLLIDGAPPDPGSGRAGMVLQDPDGQVILSRVGDEVAFGCENLGLPRDEIWGRVSWSLDAVGLRVPLDRATHRLSGGQKQRLALAAVLAMRPGLLLLDEPTANLDPAGAREVRNAVEQVLAQTTATLVIIEHRVDIWADLVDRVVVLGDDGGLLDHGDVASVLVRRGAELAAGGIWVPDHLPRFPSRSRTVGEALVSTDQLVVGRQGESDDFRLASPDLLVTSGRALAVTGSTGSGKTSLILTLAGLLPPAAGRVVASPALAGGVSSSEPHRWRSRELLTRIGTVFQEPEHQFLASTVRAELEVGPRALGLPRADADARVDSLLDRLRLRHLERANPFTLSGGEKRRLSVATVLAAAPRVLVLDEPTFGQDARTWAQLVELLAELLDDDRALVLSTHDQRLVKALADVQIRLGES